jgi:hypothetical protein
MKRFLLLLLLSGIQLAAQAQCNDLFISEYVEAAGNSRALELYNPTSAPINLSQYIIGRFRDGATAISSIPLPNTTVAAYSAYVIVLDKRDAAGTNLEIPVFNGYENYDTCRTRAGAVRYDSLAMRYEICAQYDTVAKKYPRGNVYRSFLDIACRASVFLNPVYDIPTSAMYFNGNDAVALVKGATVAADFSNVLDVVGVIGENPGYNWKDAQGRNYTENRTLVRKRAVRKGTGKVLAILSDTFRYSEWQPLPENTFTFLGRHISDCNPNNPAIHESAACVVNATQELGVFDFKMYPNPLKDNALTIEAEANVRQLEIYNLLGELIHTAFYTGENRRFQVQVPQIMKGFYLVHLHFDNQTHTAKKLMMD